AGWPHLAGQVAMEAAAPERLNVTAYGSAALLAPRIQALDGVFIAARREVAEKLGFDATVFDGWHLYDIDFSFRAWLQGVRVAAAGDLMLVHASSGGYRCGEWELYARRFREKFAAHAATSEPSIQPEICSILVRSAAEWRALTAARLALASGTPVQPPR
ncbi:MAG: hypothetical protein IT514_13280, partial [Burkholderiales bacterium]|nr:hypothetical protein [Burkholderiales bacterium]